MRIKLYWLFVAAFVVTFAGFWPSFFSGTAGLGVVRILHGVVATSWMLLVIVQAWLIERPGPTPRRLHRRLGWTSLAFAAALVVTGLMVVHRMLADPDGLPSSLRLTLAWIDLWSLLAFTLLYAGALARRRDRAVHARLMGSTVLVGLIPALGRVFAHYVPGIAGLPGALHPSFWVVEAVLVLLILRDLRAGRRRTPFAAVLAVFVAIELTMFPAAGFVPYISLARLLGYPG